MKFNLLLLVLAMSFSSSLYSQYDDKFYKPKKEWVDISDSLVCLEINFNIRDTQLVSGILLEPQAPFLDNIIFFHGAGGNVSTYLFMTAPLAEMGYRVMMIDVRGYGRSHGIPTHVGIASDAPLILDWVMQQEDFIDKPVIIYGASLGTQIATHLTAQAKELVSLLVLDGPMLSFTEIAAHSSPLLQRAMIRQFVTSPYSAEEDLPQVQVPVLIVHSEKDEDIPFSHAQKLYEVANEPKFFWDFQAGHLQAAVIKAQELSLQIQEAKMTKL